MYKVGDKILVEAVISWVDTDSKVYGIEVGDVECSEYTQEELEELEFKADNKQATKNKRERITRQMKELQEMLDKIAEVDE